MATVVNNDGTKGANGSNALMAVVFIALILVLLYFGLPLLRGGNGGGNVQTPGTVNINTK